MCDFINVELLDMEKQYITLRDSATHFHLSPPEEGRLIQCRKNVKMLKNIWDFYYAVTSCIDDWKKTAWKKIDVDDMENECKRFQKEMRNFEREVKSLKPYEETEMSIKNLLTALHAITALQNPAIRERHWNELMHQTKVG
jgi:dynein heavy chain